MVKYVSVLFVHIYFFWFCRITATTFIVRAYIQIKIFTSYIYISLIYLSLNNELIQNQIPINLAVQTIS